MFGKRRHIDPAEALSTKPEHDSPEAKALKERQEEMMRALDIWLQRCVSDKQYRHLELSIRAYVKMLYLKKSAREVAVLQDDFKVFINEQMLSLRKKPAS